MQKTTCSLRYSLFFSEFRGSLTAKKKNLREYNRSILAQSIINNRGNKTPGFNSIFNYTISVCDTLWICIILCIEEREISVKDKNVFIYSFFQAFIIGDHFLSAGSI